MYSKKYKLDKILEFNEHSPVYDEIKPGCTCYLAYLNPGERGWFLWESGQPYDPPHRIHTSVIESVDYIDGWVTVFTQNTRFTFAPFADSD